MLRRLVLMVVALGVVVACDEPSGTRGCQPEGGPDPEHRVVKCVVDGRCVGQQAHPSCPASPDDPQALCDLFGGGHRVTRVACGRNVVVWWSGGTLGFVCLYDEAGQLIGSSGATDSPSYCGGFGSWTWGAEIPRECVSSADPSLCRR